MPADTTEVVVGDPLGLVTHIVTSFGFDAAMTALVIWGLYALFTGRLVTRREHEDVKAERDDLRTLVSNRDHTISELMVAVHVAKGMFAAIPEAASVVRDETP